MGHRRADLATNPSGIYNDLSDEDPFSPSVILVALLFVLIV